MKTNRFVYCSKLSLCFALVDNNNLYCLAYNISVDFHRPLANTPNRHIRPPRPNRYGLYKDNDGTVAQRHQSVAGGWGGGGRVPETWSVRSGFRTARRIRPTIRDDWLDPNGRPGRLPVTRPYTCEVCGRLLDDWTEGAASPVRSVRKTVRESGDVESAHWNPRRGYRLAPSRGQDWVVQLVVDTPLYSMVLLDFYDNSIYDVYTDFGVLTISIWSSKAISCNCAYYYYYYFF